MSPPDDRAGRVAENTGTKDRLHRISRHFLSEGDEAFRIAVIAAPDDPQTVPIDSLARALASHGRAVAVVDVTAKLISLVRPDPDAALRSSAEQAPAPGMERFLANLRGNQPPDIMIIAATPAAAHSAACDLVLLAVPAHASGMRSAYLGLKTLAQLERTPPIGIILTGAGSCDEAAARFNTFARAAYNFLGIRVTSYSYVAGEHDRGTACRKPALPMEDIARFLLDDWRATRQRREQAEEPEHAVSNNPTTKGQP